ncbi:MAG: septum formation initiator family protein [Candidatus Omnitrophota bacterium]
MLKNGFFLMGLAIFIIAIFLPSYAKFQELKKENKELELNIKKLEKENIYLRQEKIKLTSDPNYVEKVARQKLGVVRKGEIVYKIVNEEK